MVVNACIWRTMHLNAWSCNRCKEKCTFIVLQASHTPPSLKYSFTKPTTDQLLARVKNIQRIGMKKIKQKSIQNINNQASRVLSKASCLVWVVTDKFQSMKNQTEANWDCKLVSKACIEYRGRMKNAFSICKKRNKVQWLAHGDPKSTEELCAPSISSSWLIRVTYPHFTLTTGIFYYT